MSDDLEQKYVALQERLDRLAEEQEAERKPEPAPEERFAQELAAKLAAAQSRWYSAGGDRG